MHFCVQKEFILYHGFLAHIVLAPLDTPPLLSNAGGFFITMQPIFPSFRDAVLRKLKGYKHNGAPSYSYSVILYLLHLH